ncbi:thiamine pyrophosphate-dependent dehydrogenase E1 component subunit alpha [Lactobacillus gigeriorum]|uniref:2-oxoisovalerate dehydrogenase subunit alpha n=1 Tax=Lactobacillus gigeriorum DSM 23908 = CRBIP 24.85 TaxID=1423751 RepID=I7K0Q9_9LACO|nr:thiamine pyrophosphate-dependent dehydrogenase E1 component subunit alpha [Lactobacillus gigeriorum]KRN09983.1 pdhA protein [Lactobacillus gigeriorum DSM 23908 = CRBIP 24.85]CCI87010.1 Pyruvate dehydrogenase E1 component subunit alpha [Lactobacillus gigeriorum DSM 23908 = CRBIP 24.85]
MKISDINFKEIVSSYADEFPTYQVLDEKGNVVDQEAMDSVSDELLVKMMEDMTWNREMDRRVILLNRQGALINFPPSGGQEATQYGAMMALDPKEDVLAPTYRDVYACVKLWGVDLLQAFVWGKGHVLSGTYPKAVNMYAPNVVVGGTTPQALGSAIALRFRNEKRIAFSFAGDSSTSQGDFYEAINFAGAYKANLVTVIENNKYGISVPVEHQTAAKTLAQKGVAAGIPAVRVDGMDPIAVYLTVKKAREYAIDNGPVLIEALTYRYGPHTMSDDPTRYRTEEEVNEWRKKDPLIRLGNYLTAKGLWSEEREAEIKEEVKAEAKETLARMAKLEPLKVTDLLKNMYAVQPQNIKEQIEIYSAKEEN